jgi:ABC-type antimicrobial peptide transport system permease subunit
MERLVDSALSRSRFIATVLAALAAAALLLATVGIYAVLAHTVIQRRFEIGIRAAIGATPAQILRGLVAGGLRMTATGVALGLTVSAIGSRLLTSLLFGVAPLDATAFLCALMVTIVLATCACAGPAWRASQADPKAVLESR